LISCAVTRRALPDLRTLPCRTCRTRSFDAMVLMSVVVPLNENDDVRDVTRRAGFRASTVSSSSERPSEKYSWSGSGLMFTNGRTAIVCLVVSTGRGAGRDK